jgi:chemotaxis protein CheD
MMREDALEEMRTHFLQPGCILVSDEPHLISTVLGSCVSVCLRDATALVAGMNHYVFPRPWSGQRTAQFGSLSLSLMLRLLQERGARLERLEAHVFGGAENPQLGSPIGGNNVRLALELLASKHIVVLSRDVGGWRGRHVVFNTATGETRVRFIEDGEVRRHDM